MFQLDLFDGNHIPIYPAGSEDDRVYLVAHKCRGQAVFELAICWQFGTASDPAPWWILQSTGNRVYPYWTGPQLQIAAPTIPPDIRDFYDPKTPPLPKRSPDPKRAPSLDSFI